MADPGVRDGREPLTGHEKYEKLKDLSAGAFGFVQLARNKRTGQHVAIKFLERVRDFLALALQLPVHATVQAVVPPAIWLPVACRPNRRP